MTSITICICWAKASFILVSLCNGISILGKIKRILAFSESFRPKAKLTAWPVFELVYFKAATQHFSHETAGTTPKATAQHFNHNTADELAARFCWNCSSHGSLPQSFFFFFFKTTISENTLISLFTLTVYSGGMSCARLYNMDLGVNPSLSWSSHTNS